MGQLAHPRTTSTNFLELPRREVRRTPPQATFVERFFPYVYNSGDSENVPRECLAEQCRLAQLPGYLGSHLTTLRALVGPLGQREVLVNRLPSLEVPTLVVWGQATGCSRNPKQERRPSAFRKVR
jgi:hypothetical protein